MKIDSVRLREKGWSETEIKHAEKILRKAKRRKHPHRNLLNETIYWGVTILAMFTIIAVTYWIIPLFFMAPAKVMYPTIIVIALVFGMLFSHVIKDLEHLERHHHIIFSSVIPVTSIISFLIILTKMSDIGEVTGIHHSLWLTAIVFTIAFSTPYFFYLAHQQ